MQKSIIVNDNVTELNKELEQGFKVVSTFGLMTGETLFLLERA